MTTALLFDLDYTLVEYDPDYATALERACESVGVQPSEDRLVHHNERFLDRCTAFEDDPMLGACRDLCTDYDLAADPAELAEAFVAEMVAAARTPDAVRETVTDLAAAHPLGVVTNGHGPHQRLKLESTGLDGHFETMVSPEQVGSFKPDPAIFEAATRRVPADRYVFVGDSLDHDVRAAREMGFDTVLVGDPGVDDDPAALPEVDLHVPDLDAFGRVRRLVG